MFQSDITVIADATKHKEDTIKYLISRHSNGNVNLQQAKYITKNILKEKQENLFSYKFV